MSRYIGFLDDNDNWYSLGDLPIFYTPEQADEFKKVQRILVEIKARLKID